MKKLILSLALVAATGLAFAQVQIQRNEFGTGTPGAAQGFDKATPWTEGSDIYVVPQYLPGYPTAATIWPRVIDVDCEQTDARSPTNCKGFNWLPEMGRAEYLMIRPRIVKPIIVQPQIIERTIIREVPKKPKGE